MNAQRTPAYTAPRERGERFASPRVADCYRCRPPYSDEVIAKLLGLVVTPRVLLDAGAGDGKIARALAPDLDRVDAVDPSLAMMAVGRASPGGDTADLRWIASTIEDAALEPPYGLAAAGASFHWMDPDQVFPKLARALAPGAVLAVVDGDAPVDAPFEEAASAVMIETLSRAEGHPPSYWLTPMERLERSLPPHPRFEVQGSLISAPFPFEQSVEDFIRLEHSRQSFSEEHLGPELTAFFDRALGEAVAPYATDGMLRYDVRTRVEWGRPL